MTDLQTLFRTVDELTAHEKQQLIEYLQQSQPEPTAKPGKRIFDLHPGAIVMSDDFDAELPDSFWLGEEEITCWIPD